MTDLEVLSLSIPEKYKLPPNMSRKQRRAHYRNVTQLATNLKRKWDILNEWYHTLTTEDIEKAVNFTHEDDTVNLRFRLLAELEKEIVYYTKLANKIKKAVKGIPVHGDIKQNAAIRAGQ